MADTSTARVRELVERLGAECPIGGCYSMRTPIPCAKCEAADALSLLVEERDRLVMENARLRDYQGQLCRALNGVTSPIAGHRFAELEALAAPITAEMVRAVYFCEGLDYESLAAALNKARGLAPQE